MKTNKFLFCLTLGLLVFFVTHLATADVINYSLAGDWSDTVNPNGPWSLNSGSNVMTNHIVRSVFTGWDMDGSTNPSWAIRTAYESGWNDVEIGDVIAQAWWHGNDLTNVTWTSPLDGIIDISGRSWDAFGRNRPGFWTLDINGAVIAHQDQILGLKRNDYGADFADNLLSGMSLGDISVSAGDVVRFSAGGLSTSGVDLDICLTTPVPEPSTLSLLALGLFGFIGIKRRKNKK